MCMHLPVCATVTLAYRVHTHIVSSLMTQQNHPCQCDGLNKVFSFTHSLMFFCGYANLVIYFLYKYIKKKVSESEKNMSFGFLVVLKRG